MIMKYGCGISHLKPHPYGKGKICITSQVANQAGAYRGFYSMKQL